MRVFCSLFLLFLGVSGIIFCLCFCPVLLEIFITAEMYCEQPNLNNTLYVSLIFKDNPFTRYIKHIITYVCGLLVSYVYSRNNRFSDIGHI